MKAVILAGGLGTRLSEETSVRPKPMVEIGGKPILWHLMKRSEERRVGREWSSDVCSSDLESSHSRGRIRHPAVGRDLRPAKTDGRDRRQADSLAPHEEIGRASCRERVEFRRVLFRS